MADSPLKNADGPVGVIIKADGDELPDTTQIASVRVRNEINRVPEAMIVVEASSTQLDDFTEFDDDLFKPGTEYEISAYYGSATEERIFSGVLVTSRMRLTGSGGMRIELVCRDKVIGLTEIRTSAAYSEMKDSDIMTSLISDSDAGLTADVTATTDEAAEKLRVGATDWDYLRLLADRNGMVVFVDDATVSVKEPDTSVAAALTVEVGMDILDLDMAVDAHRMIKSADATSWSEADQDVVTGNSATVPAPVPGNSTPADLAKVLSDRVHTTFTAREIPSAELTTITKSRTTRAGLAAMHGSVLFPGSGAIWPMDTLEIKGVGERFGGTGFVAATEHDIRAGTWTTRARLGLPQDWTSDSTGMAAPAAEAVNTPVHGLQIGKVLEVAPDEDGMQRIKIRLPVVGDPPAEVWARYAQPYASSGAGIQFLPEIDDEVVVAFLNADPEAPIIVGSLHNATAERPVEATEDNFVKTITTREELKMTFDDEKKIITVETPGGHILTMDDDESAFSLEDMNGNSIVMDSNGITLTTDNDITLTATGNIVAEATQDATVEGMNITCTAQTELTVEGNATAKLSSGGQTMVEGSVVMIN